MRRGKSTGYHYHMLCCGLIITLCLQTSFAQIVDLGLKAGPNYSWVRYDDAEFRKKTKTSPIFGYSGGVVASFKVRDRYFLHTEYLFTTKGRVNKTFNDDHELVFDGVLKDRIRYHYIEVPVLYNIFFNAHLKFRGEKLFKYYAGAGPIFSYWLGGRGKIFSDQHLEGNLPEDKYRIKFGQRGEDTAERDEVYIDKPNRVQVGLAIGGGILTEPNRKHRIMIDARFEYGHSWLGDAEKEDVYFPAKYDPSLQARNMGIRLSGIYLLELDSNKKARNKGKSKSNIKGKSKKRK